MRFSTSMHEYVVGLYLIVCFFNLFSDNGEAEKMLLKTMFRRSKAFMELGFHLRALNDTSFCLRTQINLTGNANNVLTIYWEVRKKINTVRDIVRGLSRVHGIPYRTQYQYAYSPQYSPDFSYCTS